MWVYILLILLTIAIVTLTIFLARRKNHSDTFNKDKLEGLYNLVSPNEEWKSELPLDNDIVEAINNFLENSHFHEFDTSIPVSANHFPDSDQVNYLVTLASTVDYILSSRKISPPSGQYMNTVTALYKCTDIEQRICVGFLIMNLVSEAKTLNIPISGSLAYYNCAVNNCIAKHNTPNATIAPCAKN